MRSWGVRVLLTLRDEKSIQSHTASNFISTASAEQKLFTCNFKNTAAKSWEVYTMC